MKKEKQTSFSELSQFQQFYSIPCVTSQQTDIIKQSQQKLEVSNNLKVDAQSYDYIRYLRQQAQQELKNYIKLIIIKTTCFGIMIGLLILIVLYDKLFFATHYYMRTREYQWGQLGFDLKRTQNRPMYDSGSNQQFSMQSSNGYGYWDPQRQPNFNSDAYHQINSQTKRDKYDLEGYIMVQLILKDFEDNDSFREYDQSVHLLQVTHNVNFKGQIVLQPTKYERSQEDLESKRKRVEKILKIEKDRYQKKYQISKYMNHQLPFCIIVPSYNNVQSRLYLRNLDSIFMQDYQNYHVVYIDDASPDKTGKHVEQYIEEKQIPKQKINVIINQKNLFALANLYTGITEHCKSGEIVMLLDGDDSFIGRQVMSLFNAMYQKHKAGLVYSRYLVISTNDRAGIGGSSRQIPEDYIKQERFRQLKGFFTSHLLSFYADLFWKVKKEDLTYQNGTFFKFAYDVALVTPIIEMVGSRIKFVEQTTYEYRYDTGINDPGWGQMEVDDIVFGKRKYKRLTEFPFIDKFYEQINNQKDPQKVELQPISQGSK